MSSLPRSVWIAICVVAVALPYWGALDNGFAWLDQREILDGALIVTRPREALALFLDDRNFAGYYRPLYNLSFSLDLALWGREATGLHATALGLHLASVALVAWIAMGSGWSGPWAATLAGLWGLHPVNSETVGLIHCRADLLATTLMLAALALWPPVGAETRHSTARRWLSLVCFALALYAKELAYLFPLLLAARWLSGRRSGHGGDARHLLAAVAIALIAGLHRLIASSPGSYTSELGLLERVATFAAVGLGYLRKLLVPVNLSLSDATWRFSELGDARWGVLIATGLLGGLAVWAWGRRPELRPWLLLLALTVLPVAQIVPLLHFQAERYLYLPSLAFVGGAVAAARRASSQGHAGRVLAVAAIAVAAGYALRVRERLPTFRDDLTLFGHEVGLDPRYREGLSFLALAVERDGRPADAEPLHRAALERDPRVISYVDFNGTAVNLSRNLLLQERPEAVQEVFDACAPAMSDPEALRELGYNLAVADYRLGRFEPALESFRNYLQRAPTSAGALYLAGVSALRLGRGAEAREWLGRYLATYPDAPDAAQVRGLLESSD